MFFHEDIGDNSVIGENFIDNETNGRFQWGIKAIVLVLYVQKKQHIWNGWG